MVSKRENLNLGSLLFGNVIKKLILSFVIVSLLVGVVGYFSITQSQEVLEKSIGTSFVSLAIGTLDKIDRNLQGRIEEFQLLSENPMLKKFVAMSNQEFEELDNVTEYVNQKDTEWTSVPREEITLFMSNIINNELSEELRRKRWFYEKLYGYRLFGEIFVTNKYGANIAQTGKTSDYRQDDEEWWLVAKKEGLFIRDVEYDESSDVYSTDIGIRVDDDEGNFLGVIKVVLNIEEVINIIKELEVSKENVIPGQGLQKTVHFKLLTEDRKVIYSTFSRFELFEDISKEKFFNEMRGDSGYFIVEGDEPEIELELFAYARSRGYGNFEGLGWIFFIEQDTEEIFAPVVKLSNSVFFISGGLMILAIIIGFYISHSTSILIKKLQQISKELVNRIEEREKAEKGLRRSEEKYRRLVEGLEQEYFFYSHDTKGMFRYLSPSIKKILGYTQKEFSKHYIISEYLTDNPINKEFARRTNLTIKGKKQPPYLLEVFHKDGSIHWLEVKEVPILDEKGNVMAVEGIAHDVTKRMKAEKLLVNTNVELKKERTNLVQSLMELDEATKDLDEINVELKKQNMELVKSAIDLAEATKKVEDRNVELISLASHEMRTPLTSISSLLQLILGEKVGKVNVKQKKGLEIALHDARRLNMVIKNMVDVSRIEEGRVIYEFRQFNLLDLVKQCINTVDLMLKEKNISMKVKHQGIFGVVADKDRIEQVLLNLVTNAIKYGKRGGKIWISLKKDGSNVILSVKDDGVGISEKDLVKLFVKEFQVKSTSKRALGGFGYGLYISKKILNKNNGKMWVKSTLGKGSTFYISLSSKQKV